MAGLVGLGAFVALGYVLLLSNLDAMSTSRLLVCGGLAVIGIAALLIHYLLPDPDD